MRGYDEDTSAFEEYLESPVLVRRLQHDYYIYTINDKIAVDKICQFENLNEELETLRLKLGLPERLELPKAKTHFRKHRGHYRELFTEQDRTRIEKLFAREIKLFDYRF